MLLAAHGATNRGRRPHNEDSHLVDLAAGLFLVADGMGGHNAGEVASELAVSLIREAITTGPDDRRVCLESAITRANERIFEAAHECSDYSGMGTTVSAAWIVGNQAVYANVGDSRIYRLHDGVLTQLTTDDSWITQALATGVRMTATEIEVHPMRHVLTEVVGVRPDLGPAAYECELSAGDMLLMCSDGLHGAVPAERLAAGLTIGDEVDAIAESLVSEALARGATDNVTAIVVRCG
jgi:protein phosphatase